MSALIPAFLVLALYFSRGERGPIWAMAIPWLICVAPLTLGVLRYTYMSEADIGYALTLIAFMLCYVVGVSVYQRRSAKPERLASCKNDILDAVDFEATLPYARICWWAACIGTALICIDFALLDGVGLSDLAALRDAYHKTEVTIFARLGSVLTWGCLYCFTFALFYRARLGLGRFVRFTLPIAGYFLIALFSAGRQAAFQIMLFAILVPLLQAARRSHGIVLGRREVAGIAFVSLAMVAYMGYVAVARNDGLMSDDKREVLYRLFDIETSRTFDAVVEHLGAGVGTTLVEALVYFSSPIALFSSFLMVHPPEHTYGAMSLPLFFRQIESLTGISVASVMEQKREMMVGAGVIGVGWTTGISDYISDFGKIGAGAVLFVQGYYTAYSWRRALAGHSFHASVVALVMLIAAIYMPFFAASGDTNLLLLWLFSITASALQARKARGVAGELIGETRPL